jgi:tetratricopeptide (TPR) repeat protein
MSGTHRWARLLALASLSGFIAVPGCARKAAPLPPPPKAVNMYVAGAVALQQGEREQAVQKLLDATTANPRLVMARELLGDLFREMGDLARAETEYEALVKLDPYTASSWRRLGVAQHLLNKLLKAEASYLRAIKLDPADWESHMNVGVVYFALGRRDDAIRMATRATEIMPGSAVAWSNLGAVLDASTRYVDAEKAYRKSLELDTNQPTLLLNLSTNLLLQKKPAEAVSVLEQLVKTRDSAQARKRYGDALLMVKRDAEAEAQYRKALEQDPGHCAALNAIAALRIAEYKKGLQLDDAKRDAALAAWRQSLEIDPEQQDVKEKLAAFKD